MSGYIDSASRYWLVKRDRGLNISGFASIEALLDSVVRLKMLEDDGESAKHRVREIVEEALRHMDEEPDAAPGSDAS